jgi:purine catabolism regulator
MGITVREALELSELSGVTVVAGATGLERVISTVNVMEVPDISSFVESGELLLTTTYPIHNDPRALEQLIPTLVERGLAGLAVKPARYIQAIPPQMIHQANSLHFPLLQLPAEASFTKILNPIMTEILHRQGAMLRRVESIQRSLTHLVLHGEGLGALVRAFAQLLELPVAVADAEFTIMAHSFPIAAEGGPLLRFLDQVRIEGLYPSHGAAIQRGMWHEGRLSSVLIQPVQVSKQVYGFLIIWAHGGDLTEQETLAVEQAALVTALEFQKQRAVLETERRFRVDFIRELLAGRITAPEEAYSRASVYGWDLTPSWMMLLIKVFDRSEDPYSVERALVQQQRLEQVIGEALAAHPPSHRIVVHLGETTLLLLVPPDSHPESAKETGRKVADRVVKEMTLGRSAKEQRIHVGLSRPTKAISEWPDLFREAQEALQIGSEIARTPPVTHYDDLGLYRLLTRVDDPAELERFCQQHLGALLAYDQRRGTELIATLEAIVTARGSLHEAAASLFIHFNTLRYRIKRIEEILGIRLDSRQDLLLIDAALKALRVMKARQRSRA